MPLESFVSFVNQELPNRIHTDADPLTTPADYIWVTTGIGRGAKAVDPATIVTAGQSAYELAVQEGFVGTLSEWLESLQGDSTYAIIVANGYTGTEEEWNEALGVIASGLSAPDGTILHKDADGFNWTPFNELHHARMLAAGFQYDSQNETYFIDQGELPG